VALSGQRGDVPVDGGFGGVVASSGAVLRLEAEVREGTAGTASDRRRKTWHGGGGGIRPAVAQFPFKRGRWERSGGGLRESSDAWGTAGER
jgi:hypothetical protein